MKLEIILDYENDFQVLKDKETSKYYLLDKVNNNSELIPDNDFLFGETHIETLSKNPKYKLKELKLIKRVSNDSDNYYNETFPDAPDDFDISGEEYNGTDYLYFKLEGDNDENS